MAGREKLSTVIEQVLREITPAKEELATSKKSTAKVVETLSKALKGQKAQIFVGGSGSKNTQLRNSHDIDVFILFDYKKHSSNSANLSETVSRAITGKFKGVERIHGSRDYFHTIQDNYSFEIIPILKIRNSGQAKNITDVSPLHTRWVNKHSGGRITDIRLLKAFCKAQKVYGAESYVRGFSGYACEILAIHYKSFINVLKASSKWKDRQVIDPERHYKNRNPMLFLNKSKVQSPLIIIDPVQPGRNVTAALSEESLSAFKKAAAKFISRPSASFFKRKAVSKSELTAGKGKNNSLLLVTIKPAQGKRDVIGAALLHKYHFLKKGLSENLFKAARSGWEWDEKKEAILWYAVSSKLPPKYEIRKGPKESDMENSERFRKAHKAVFRKNRRLYAKVQRKYQSPKELAKEIIRAQPFKNKAKAVKIEWR